MLRVWNMNMEMKTGEGDGYSSAAGFSLVELVIVIILLGLILSIGAVSYVNISQGMNLQAAKKQVEAAMIRAKLSARQENVEYHVVFYPDSDGSNPNTYEFWCYTYNDVDDSWSLQPTDKSVSGEKVVSSGGHHYVKIGNSVKIVDGGTVVVKPAGTEQTVTFIPGSGGEQAINLLAGSKAGSVSIDAQGMITK
jgi:prepilin-type N-terminal cleavage/methylation domain-containing protein